MRNLEIIEKRVWVSPTHNYTVSSYSIPSGEGWELTTVGYTWKLTENGRTTIGLGRMPVATREEALEVAERFCADTGAQLVA